MKNFFKESILFLAVQLLGIWVAYSFVSYLPSENLSKVEFNFGFGDLIAFIVIIGAFILIGRHSPLRRAILYKTFFAIILFVGIQTVLALWLNVSLSIILSVLLIYALFKTKKVWIHNLSVVLALAGIGGTFGASLTPLNAVFILVILSFYDIVAVYKTKHMVQMAEDMIKSRAIFGIVLPSGRGWFESLENVQLGGRFMILGSGDIALPLILIASIVGTSIFHSFLVLVFSMAGLLITHILFVRQKERKPMAALPPIATMSIIGYLISTII